MESDMEDIEDIDCSIDIDLIKDEQNPMYQNVDIQRQRLLSVLDRALEKISIAYVLDEMLTKNVSLLHQYMTKREINSILSLYRYAQHLDESPEKLQSTVMRRSALLKSGNISSKSINANSFNKSKISSVSSSIARPSGLSISDQQEPEKSQDQEKGNSSQWQLIKYYYSSIIAKLHYVPEVTNLAKYMIYKKPVGSIKYYVYLKDLRDYVLKILYQTKTDEVNYEKSIKRAYVKNQKEKPQAEVVNKILQDKWKEKVHLEQQIKNDIEKEKLIQAEMNVQLLYLANDMIHSSEKQILERTENHQQIQEENKVKFAESSACYNKQLDDNLISVKILRKNVQKLEVTLKKILENYDNTIGVLHGEFEVINDGFLNVESLYNALKEKFDAQEEIYIELMAEKKEYVEMTALRIRYNRAAKIVQLWWREILCRKWKWRKTYLAAQLKRKDLAPAQRAKMKKILKKISQYQKKMIKKW